MSKPTYRDIARIAQCSTATVSYALSHRPGVSPATRKRIQEVAKRLGYQPNPMVSALMAQQRSAKPHRASVRAIIAYLTARVPVEARTSWGISHSTRQELYKGALKGCADEGYLLEQFFWEDFKDNPQSFLTNLRARNVPGIIVWGITPEAISQFKNLDRWAIASVTRHHLDDARQRYDSAAADHYFNTWEIMDKLRQLGYRRIGYASTMKNWMRANLYSSQAAYLAWIAHSGSRSFLIYWEEQWRDAQFLQWFDKNRPDAIIAGEHEPLVCLQKAGYRIPEDIGFAHLDLDSHWQDLAGIRQDHVKVGEAAARLVIDQINRNEYGLPDIPKRVLIPGHWVSGPSVRNRNDRSA